MEVNDPWGIRGKRVALDTSVFIYALEDNKNFPAAPALLKSLVTTKSVVFASVLVLTELLTKYYEANLIGVIPDRVSFLTQHVRLVDISQSIAVKSAELRAKFHLTTPDAIHLASALESESELFFTADRGFKKASTEDLYT